MNVPYDVITSPPATPLLSAYSKPIDPDVKSNYADQGGRENPIARELFKTPPRSPRSRMESGTVPQGRWRLPSGSRSGFMGDI